MTQQEAIDLYESYTKIVKEFEAKTTPKIEHYLLHRYGFKNVDMDDGSYGEINPHAKYFYVQLYMYDSTEGYQVPGEVLWLSNEEIEALAKREKEEAVQSAIRNSKLHNRLLVNLNKEAEKSEYKRLYEKFKGKAP